MDTNKTHILFEPVGRKRTETAKTAFVVAAKDTTRRKVAVEANVEDTVSADADAVAVGERDTQVAATVTPTEQYTGTH